jgi:hypothetical protein
MLETNEVGKFVYLGSMVEKNGKIQNEINERNGMASKLFIIWLRVCYRIKTHTKCKITIYNTYFKMILLYGAET